MTDFDLDRLGDVWRQQPDPVEMERLQKSAAAVARRARITQVTDVLAALVVAAVVIFLVASNPRPGTVVMGGGAILVLLFSNHRLRKVRRIELEHLSGSTEEMLDQSIDRVETTLRHLRVSLIGFPLTVLVGALVAYASQSHRILDAAANWPLRSLLLPLGVLIVMGVVIFHARALGRSRRELGRLQAMREAYRREHEPGGP
jgi:dihydrofolate reductase